MKKIVLITGGIFVSVCITMILLMNYAFSPFENARSKAMHLIAQQALVEKVEQFYWYRGQTETYTLLGTKATGEKIYIIIDSQKSVGSVYASNELVDEQSVRERIQNMYPNASISNIVIGLDNQVVIWEVNYRQGNQLNYAVFDAKTGHLLHEIKNASNE